MKRRGAEVVQRRCSAELLSRVLDEVQRCREAEIKVIGVVFLL
jgi:hypothetical protein